MIYSFGGKVNIANFEMNIKSLDCQIIGEVINLSGLSIIEELQGYSKDTHPVNLKFEIMTFRTKIFLSLLKFYIFISLSTGLWIFGSSNMNFETSLVSTKNFHLLINNLNI